MSVLTIIKKIGDKVISIVEWPVKHAAMLAAFLGSVKKDYPATKTALVSLVEKFEAIGPEAMAAIAAKGFDVPDDLKTMADLEGLFSYVQTVLLPTIEADYADFETDKAIAPTVTVAAPTAEAVSVSPGLHNIVPA